MCDVCSWPSVVMCSRGASLIFNEMAAVKAGSRAEQEREEEEVMSG